MTAGRNDVWAQGSAGREGGGGRHNRQVTYLRLPGSITRTQCTGTVPKTSEEGVLWLDMDGGRGSSFNVELEKVDDEESLEALHKGGGSISG